MTTITADEVYQTFHDRVLQFFRSRLESREDAEDLTSEVFLKVTRSLPLYDAEKASLSTWIYTISRHTLTDHFRCRYEPEELLEEPCENDMVEARLLREEMLQELYAALTRMEQDQRDIVIMHYYQGYPLTEIARRMCMSYGAVKLRHTKALKTLKLALSQEEALC